MNGLTGDVRSARTNRLPQSSTVAARVNLCKFISILGGGPAGASAAIAASRESELPFDLIEKSRFPRHKVCGEFFSPEIQPELERLGAWDAFLAAGPARIRRMKLHFGRREKVRRLPEPAWGLSRYAFDTLLLDRAELLGAEVTARPTATPARDRNRPQGRRHQSAVDGYSDLRLTLTDRPTTPWNFSSSTDATSASTPWKEDARMYAASVPKDFLTPFDFDLRSRCPSVAGACGAHWRRSLDR